MGASQNRSTTSRERVSHTATLADRLDATRAAERAAGIAVTCGRVGCSRQASSTVRGIAFCAGHAGFAAVGVA